MHGVVTPTSPTASRWQALAPWAAVLTVTLLYVLNKVDAMLLAPMASTIKASFKLTDFQISLLLGPAYAVFYGVCGLPMGSIVDRRPIRWVMFTGLAVWSLATAACGLVTGFAGLALARIVVGAGESTLTPAAYLMIASKFSRERRTLPLSIYALGSSLGVGLGLMIGGYAAGLATAGKGFALPGLGWEAAWRVAFLLLGVIGLLMAPLAFSVPEPTLAERVGAKDTSTSASMLQFLRQEWRRAVPLLILFLAMGSGGVACLVWLPTYATRILKLSHATSSATLGALVLFGGILGHALSGFLIDWHHRRGGFHGSVMFAMGAAVIALPTLMIAVTVGKATIFFPLVTLLYVLFVPWSGYGVASLIEITPHALRGRISALYLMICSAGGQVLGPMLVGGFNDYLFHDETKLGTSIALVAALSLVVVLVTGGAILWRDRRGPQVQPA